MTRFEAAIVFAFSSWRMELDAEPDPVLLGVLAADVLLLGGVAAMWWGW